MKRYWRGRDLIDNVSVKVNRGIPASIMELYKLTENCDYGALQAEMIRDRIVVRIRYEALSKGLQLDPNLTLEKAKKKSKTAGSGTGIAASSER